MNRKGWFWLALLVAVLAFWAWTLYAVAHAVGITVEAAGTVLEIVSMAYGQQ